MVTAMRKSAITKTGRVTRPDMVALQDDGVTNVASVAVGGLPQYLMPI